LPNGDKEQPQSPKTTWNTNNEGTINESIDDTTSPKRSIVTPNIGTTPAVQHWEQRSTGTSSMTSSLSSSIPEGIFSNNEKVISAIKDKHKTPKAPSSETHSLTPSDFLCLSSTKEPIPGYKTRADDASISSSDSESESEDESNEGYKLRMELQQLEHKMRRKRN
jgi:hypothetical protein